MAAIVKTVDGIALASVKTFNGLAAASLKSINGQDATSGGGGDSLIYSNGVGTPGSYTGNAEFSFYVYYGTKFTAPGSVTIHTAELRMDRFGTVPAGTMTAAIYTNSSGHPGTLIGSASTSIDRTTIPTSETWLAFEDISASISNGVDYWVVLYASSAETGGSIRWYWENGSAAKNGSTDGSSWDSTAAADLGVKLYGA